MQHSQTIKSHYDVIIIGARCAGASTALLLARAGVRVLLVDRHKPGRDVISTHALMRTGVVQLRRWGVLPQIMAAGTPPVKQATFHYESETVPLNIKAEHGVDSLYAPRRTVLDSVLVKAAANAGAEIHHGVSLKSLQFSANGRVTGANLIKADGDPVTVTSDLVIGADGRQSLVARLVGAQTCAQGSRYSGYVYAYYTDLPDDGFHWYFGNGVAAGVIPTNNNQHCVFAGVPSDQFADTFANDLTGGYLRTLSKNSPELLDAVNNSSSEGRLRGFAGSPGFLKQPYGPGWSLVGDAGYFKDPLTAHGISAALRDAELLSQAVVVGSQRAFGEYREARDALSLSMLDVTDAIASFDWDLDEVKGLHARLNTIMKTEARYVARLSAPIDLAA